MLSKITSGEIAKLHEQIILASPETCIDFGKRGFESLVRDFAANVLGQATILICCHDVISLCV
jgi:hypothetical protein